MGGVDDKADEPGLKKGSQSIHAPETSDPNITGRQERLLGDTREGGDHISARSHQRLGQVPRIARATEYEDSIMWHGQ